jgi:hypothetical protein
MAGKYFVVIAIVLAALALTQPAHASIIAVASGGGLPLCTGSDGGTGTLTLNCPAGGDFSSVLITASGPPLLPVPDLTTTVLTVTTVGSVLYPIVLSVDITSSGFTFLGGPITAIGTINNLIGTDPGPFIMSVQGDANPPIFFPTCTGSCVQNLSGTALPATSDSVHYSLTFTAPGQSVNSTIQITSSVPEPGSLPLIGSALLGVRLLARRRRKAHIKASKTSKAPQR